MSPIAFRDPTPASDGHPVTRAAKALMGAGVILGLPPLLVCLVIWSLAYHRIGSPTNATRPTAELTYRIEIKSRSGYVEEDYGRRYDLMMRLLPIFWLMAAPGFVLYANRERRKRQAPLI